MMISMFPVGNAFAAQTNWFGSIDQYRSGQLSESKTEWWDNDETTGMPLTTAGGILFTPLLEISEIRIISSAPVRVRFFTGNTPNYVQLGELTTQGTGQLETYSVDYKDVRLIRPNLPPGGKAGILYEFEAYVKQPPDQTPPEVPTGLSGNIVGTDAVLTWFPVPDSDLDKYFVYVDGVKVLETKSTTATIPMAKEGVKYTYQVSAIDFARNESARSSSVVLERKPPDTTPPAVPTGLVGTGADKQAMLKWNANTESDLAGYVIYQDDREIHRTTSISASVTGLTNGRTYQFALAAYDTSGNVSAKSNAVSVVPSDKIDVNLIPNMDSIIVQIISGTSPFEVDWGSGNDTFNASQYTITGLTANTDYTVTITDAQGRIWSATINTGDKKGFIPPTFPSPQDLFQRMLNVFGTAGTIAVAIIGGAVALGILCVLAMWAWRLLKRWLAKSK
ncbi:fibronectin type III domain-containing protein [Paenibacillus sp. JCM 10914]|uniref:fibronectin type III domain-containing protein n=1 Tax=Paenibacillus sp. JCM 10914 TaxID=1236974 RepID=UPI0011DC8B85|nr:hypothetical protein [Paenibacillus sp. JCM 10914]